MTDLGSGYGPYTIISGPYKNKTRRTVYEVRCVCGEIKRLTPAALKQVVRNKYKYCGKCSPSLKHKDLSGKVFGKLTAVKRVDSIKGRASRWELLCECGNKHVSDINTLRTGGVTSCGCSTCRNKIKNIAGRRFGRLIVLEYVKQSRNKVSIWKCLCDCGTTKEILSSSLIQGMTNSCGCLNLDNKRAMIGPLDPNWNHSLTKIDREKQGRTPKDKIWAIEIKERDNFLCVVCRESPSGFLVSHHLNSYLGYPSQRTDISNGVCLCSKCHKAFHKEYGNKRNTKEQFYEWLKLKKMK